MSVEQGVHNGMMLDDALFGCARNADAIIPSLINLEFGSGGGIDITFLGMERWINTVTSTSPISMAI